jgi:hypothetical protein
VNKLTYSLMVLVLLSSSALAASSGQAQTSVTISDVISITLDTCPAGGDFGFGAISQGASNVEMECQDASNGAIEITVEEPTNIAIDLDVKGTDYIGPGGCIIPVQNTKVDIGDNVGLPNPVTLSAVPQTMFTGLGGKKLEERQLWLWVDTLGGWLPGGQYAGTYTFNAEPAA